MEMLDQVFKISYKKYSIEQLTSGQMHSLQSTENYVILAENSYLYDPCERKNTDDTTPHYKKIFSFEKDVEGRVYIMEKSTGNFQTTIKVPAMFITHVLGSYEDKTSNLMHFDVLQYDDAGWFY